MNRAEARDVPVDLARAADFVNAAEEYFADADQAGTSLNGSLILYYQSCISAMSGVLAAAGRDVGGGDSGHIVLVGEANGILGAAFTELLDRVSDDRRERNDVSYAAVQATPLAVETARQDARELIDAARYYVERVEA
jgi:hypothetical protein